MQDKELRILSTYHLPGLVLDANLLVLKINVVTEAEINHVMSGVAEPANSSNKPSWDGHGCLLLWLKSKVF